MKITAFIFMASALLGQAPKTPLVPKEHITELKRAAHELAVARAEEAAAKAELKRLQAEDMQDRISSVIVNDCPGDFYPSLDNNAGVICLAKAPTPAASSAVTAAPVKK